MLSIPIPIVLAFLSTGVLAGLVSGLLGLGGGVVVVPLLAYLLEQNNWGEQIMQVATGTSQAVIFCTTLSALLMHRRKMKIAWNIVFALGLAASVGAIIGRYIIQYIPSKWLSIAFVTFIIYTVIKMLWAKTGKAKHTKDFHLHLGVCCLFGLIVGIFVSMLGVSGGIFIVPFLLHYGFSMVQASSVAVGAAVLISLSSTLGAMVWGQPFVGVPYSIGHVYLPAWGCIAIASICSAPIGVHWAHKIDSNRLRRYFAIFLMGIALHLLWRMYS